MKVDDDGQRRRVAGVARSTHQRVDVAAIRVRRGVAELGRVGETPSREPRVGQGQPRHHGAAAHDGRSRRRRSLLVEHPEAPVPSRQREVVGPHAAHIVEAAIEVQRGDYLGEDDIVRLEDDFGRTEAKVG